ncbi:MAG: pantetheine-phosphate adenylyltransferase [Spirochaetales bacterium]|nr:pantetheine-phosphate adenylyltransferase [Spirochaetales bacterium]
MQRALVPGSFDPPTNGHLNLIDRATRIFPELDVVISVNPNKSYLFSPEERFEMMSQLMKDYTNVKVHVWDNLIINFAREHQDSVIIRGVRAMADFEYEFELSMTNKGLAPEIETIFLPTDPKYFVLRASAIKEIAGFHGDVSLMVPDLVAQFLRSKLSGS